MSNPMKTPDTKTTEGKIEVMQAEARGEEIQFRPWGEDDWLPTMTPDWNWQQRDYRIKPRVPREWRLFFDEVGRVTECIPGQGWHVSIAPPILVREVIE